jgi:lipopolysaccharide export system protein LptC
MNVFPSALAAEPQERRSGMTMDDPTNDPEEAPKKRLSFIRPRARKFDAKQSRRIGRLRLLLPLGTALVLGLLVLWPYIQPSKVKTMVVENVPDLVIRNLNFTGLDSKNEPYSLSATRATRPAGLKNIYDFEKAEGEITLLDGTWISGKAQYGRYDPGAHRLWLGGDVQMFQDKGYQFTTDEADVDLSDDNAWGSRPVLFQGDFGEIRGTGFRLIDGGKEIVVLGPAHASLDLHGSASSDKPAPVP